MGEVVGVARYRDFLFLDDVYPAFHLPCLLHLDPEDIHNYPIYLLQGHLAVVTEAAVIAPPLVLLVKTCRYSRV